MHRHGYDLIHCLEIFRNHLKQLLFTKSGQEFNFNCGTFNKLFDFRQLTLYLVKIVSLIRGKIIISMCHLFLFLTFFHERDRIQDDGKCPSVPAIVC